MSHHDAPEWIDRSIDLVEAHAPRIGVRGDTEFSLTADLDRWAARIDVIFGHEHVAAFDDQPGRCTRPYRVVVVREGIAKTSRRPRPVR